MARQSDTEQAQRAGDVVARPNSVSEEAKDAVE